MRRLKSIQDYLIPYANHELYFTEPVVIKANDISIFECWGVASHEGIWLIDEAGKWYKWQPCDRNAQLVKTAIELKLNALKKTKDRSTA